MASHSVVKEKLQEAVDALVAAGNNKQHAATALSLPINTYKSRLQMAQRAGVVPGKGTNDPNSSTALRGEIEFLKRELKEARETALTESAVKSRIIGLKQAVEVQSTPEWVIEAKPGASSPGVPLLFLSDLHWGEKVNSSQIGGVNKYSLAIAKERLHTCADRAVHLLRILDPKMRYPGLVLPLGGDMISGNIHDELANTNELNTMPTVLDLFGELKALISAMADTFGAVFVPCVTGNHGRDTHKIWTKDRHATSFDWLLYCFLAKHFEGDKRITFFIPDGPDAYFKIYGHRYLLTHGDQFRGGDGVIGALGPIIRGDHRKRSRNSQIDMPYDSMILGHWHQYMHLTRLIVNGSLKGYDEYAYSNNFPFEFPQQALWVTHPKHGITYRMPVFVGERPGTSAKTSWVSVPSR